jgi:hypothetical protein
MYDKSYVERIIQSNPSWETCVFLNNEIKNEKYGRLLGGISAAIRNGSEITHEDWGNDWAVLATQYLPSCSNLMCILESKDYKYYDKWLQENELIIISDLHQLFSVVYREMA